MLNQRLALLALTASAVMLAACDDARTLEAQEGASVGTCATCHGFPPLQTRSGAAHPQSQACFACHPQTVDRDNQLIPGGPHANGNVDASFGHDPGYIARHSADAIADIQTCSACHGQDYDGGLTVTIDGEQRVSPSCNDCHAGVLGIQNWQSNCTFCHGTRNNAFTFENLAQAAPPEGVRGETATTDPHVGAHQKHLGNGSVLTNGFECFTCHPLIGGLAHLDGQVPITFQLQPLASSDGATPSFTKGTQTCSSVYCHGSTLQGGTATAPRWTVALTACNSCHGIPPPTGQHDFHTGIGVACATCHDGYTDTSVNKATHVNGARDVVRAGVRINGWDCTTCHAL
ncbi:MAG TPA: CxxxxCH/CxxCH domain-containing protein [Anaeromyxobacter sp.]|nr:CxxxxCH/CxxCH domain-containing protein [Anaeromyxobacter sp.]